jgi:8-oxo-dGTP diphosphatase
LLVVAAALHAENGRILLQRRRLSAAHGGLWEFPGGKVEAGEHPQAALRREIDEELGLDLAQAALVPAGFATSDERAPPGLVILLYHCHGWRGTPECRDAEALAWVRPDELAGHAMPPLDIALARLVFGATM